MKVMLKLLSAIILFTFSFAISGCGDQQSQSPPQQQSESIAPIASTTQPQQVTHAPAEKPKTVEQHITGPGPNGEGIKGHVDKKGVKIYHLPGDPYYNRTTHVAEWFFSEKDAQAAGYRHILK